MVLKETKSTTVTSNTSFFGKDVATFLSAYLALVGSLGRHQIRSGSVEINDRFLEDGVFDKEEKRERKDNILEKGSERQDKPSPNMESQREKRRDCDLKKQMLKKQRSTEIDTVVMMSGVTLPKPSST